MRHLTAIAGFALMACAGPSFAQSRADVADDELVASLPHPFEVEEAGDRIGRAMGAILDVPVGGIVQSVDPRAPVDPDETIGDLAGHGDPDYRGRMEDRVSGLSMKMADAMRVLAAKAPALRRSISRIERDLDAAVGEFGRGD